MNIVIQLIVAATSCGQVLSDDADRRPKWVEFYKAEAAEYRMFLEEDRSKTLQLRETPIIIWSNPVRNGDDGAVFVWTRNGRAEVVGQVFSFVARGKPNMRGVRHALHTLSLQPVTAEHDGRRVWYPKRPGIELKPIPGAKPPPKSRALRLVQMRSLARDFSAQLFSGDEKRELRLMPQPLFRNEKSSEDVLDGALFAFVMGTDPEVLLTIESRQLDGKPVWHYGIARFAFNSLTVRHKDTQVWSYQRGQGVRGPQNLYWGRRLPDRSVSSLEAAHD